MDDVQNRRADADAPATGATPEAGVDGPFVFQFVIAVLILIGLSALLVLVPAIRTPVLHTILDSCIFLTSAILSLTLWEVGRRSDDSLIRPLAIVFGIVSIAEFYHTLTALRWSASTFGVDPLIVYRLTESWGPSSYLLPVSLVAVILIPALRRRTWLLAAAMAATAGALLLLSAALPAFTPSGLLGMTRPTLALIPVLWIAAGVLYDLRERSPMGLAIVATSILVVPSFAAMCYSTSPYDAPALIGHLGKLVGRTFLLFSVLQLASRDITRRIAAEGSLRDLALGLEQLVAQRTASLRQEMATRAEAEARTQMQLARLNLLHEITAAIGRRLDLSSVLQATVASVERQFGAAFAVVVRFDAARQDFLVGNVGTAGASYARAMALERGARIPPLAQTVTLLSQGEVIYEADLSVAATPFARRLADAGLGSGLVAPLIFEDKLFGALIVARLEESGFSSGDCAFLRKLGVHVALAAHQAELYAALQRAYDDLSQSQQTALQRERLSALGQMASGIAHDINNAITPLSLNTQALLKTEPSLPPRIRNYLETVKRVVNDIAATAARMREFYRQRSDGAPLDAVDLNELALQTMDLTRARWSNMPLERGIVIGMRTALSKSLPRAAGVASEIRDALTNLIFNAVDAMPKGGGITVQTGAMGEGNAQRVYLEVADTGVGMDEETRRRCLEPFFTTKGERGTGLGLAMVFGAMQRQGGEIEIESAPGEGTLFRLLFRPAKDVPPEAVVPAAAAPSQLNLLVVDDDPYVLDSMRVVLEVEGHKVETADSGPAALRLLDAVLEGGRPFDVVFTDLGMPEMDGRALAMAIKARAPDLPVVLLTGWGKHVGEQAIGQGVDYALSKPASLEGLQEALAHCLASRRPVA